MSSSLRSLRPSHTLPLCSRRKKCDQCDATFSRVYELKKHQKTFHSLRKQQEEHFGCKWCEATFARAIDLQAHHAEHRAGLQMQQEEQIGNFFIHKSAHRKSCLHLRYFYHTECKFLSEALEIGHAEVIDVVSRLKLRMTMFSLGLSLNCEFIKLNPEGEVDELITPTFRAGNIRVRPETEVYRTDVLDALEEIADRMHEFVQLGSGWSLSGIYSLDAEVNRCQPLQGSCGLHRLKHKKGGAPIWTGDGFNPNDPAIASGECFFLACASHFVSRPEAGQQSREEDEEEAETKYRLALETFVEKHFNKTVRSPVRVEQVGLFEEANQHLKLAINVCWISEEDGEVWPVHVSTYLEAENTLLLVLNRLSLGGGASVSHYTLAEDVGDLLRLKGSSGRRRKIRPQLFCFNCYTITSNESGYRRHVSWCHTQLGRRFIMPTSDEKLKYEPRLSNAIPAPYAVFYDFETRQETRVKMCSCSDELRAERTRHEEGYSDEELAERKIEELNVVRRMRWDEEEELGRCRTQKRREQVAETWEKRRAAFIRKLNNPPRCTHRTRQIADQVAYSYALVMVDRFDNIVEGPLSYIGEDADVRLVKELLRLEEEYVEHLREGGEDMEELPRGRVEALRKKAEPCHLCGKLFEKDDQVHLDHCHLSGR